MERINSRYAQDVRDAGYFRASEYAELTAKLERISKEREMLRVRAEKLREASIKALEEGRKFTQLDELNVLQEWIAAYEK